MKTIILSLLVLAIYNRSQGLNFIVNRRSGMLLSVENGSFENGAGIVQLRNSGAESQKWDVSSFNEDGQRYYVFRAGHSGKALEVPNFSKRNDLQLIQNEHNGGHNQQFIVSATSGGFFRLVPRHSLMFVQVRGSSQSQGAAVIQGKKKRTQSMEWRFGRA